MSGKYTEGVLTLLAGAALAAHVRVKVSSGTTTDPVEVVAAGAGEACIGVTEYAAASGDPVAIRPVNMSGSQRVTASAAIGRGASFYGAANGKIATTVSGSIQGVALEAATADGDVIEVLFT